MPKKDLAYVRNVRLELFEVVPDQPTSKPHAVFLAETCDHDTVASISQEMLRLSEFWSYPAEVRVSYTACE
jgi:hypothetical protein